ncbi:hypothetical protein QYM36_007246 [Artemia franciscana]|uniref:Uncharacterized protein n=1 Tax=Artemia franciscana TaxID=6661 RepID=A0AA88HVK4_ARTSF|nr:hypothetical protein QYM36_007246 [Artemia franciscana]
MSEAKPLKRKSGHMLMTRVTLIVSYSCPTMTRYSTKLKFLFTLLVHNAGLILVNARPKYSSQIILQESIMRFDARKSVQSHLDVFAKRKKSSTDFNPSLVGACDSAKLWL